MNLITRMFNLETVWRQCGEGYFLWRFHDKVCLEIVWGFHGENMVNQITPGPPYLKSTGMCNATAESVPGKFAADNAMKLGSVNKLISLVKMAEEYSLEKCVFPHSTEKLCNLSKVFIKKTW